MFIGIYVSAWVPAKWASNIMFMFRAICLYYFTFVKYNVLAVIFDNRIYK